MTLEFRYWLTQAFTAFCNGCVSGFGTGLAVGGGAVATTDSTNAQTLTVAAAFGAVLTMVAHGIKHTMVWHGANSMPNPFFASSPLAQPPAPPAP